MPTKSSASMHEDPSGKSLDPQFSAPPSPQPVCNTDFIREQLPAHAPQQRPPGENASGKTCSAPASPRSQEADAAYGAAPSQPLEPPGSQRQTSPSTQPTSTQIQG